MAGFISVSISRLTRINIQSYNILNSKYLIQKMEKVTDVKFGPLEKSIYLKPMRMFYKQVFIKYGIFVNKSRFM